MQPVHSYHPLAEAYGVLSEHCERCTTMLVCHLDQKHLKTFQIEQHKLTPHVRAVLWETPAIKVQRWLIRSLAQGSASERETAKAYDEAANQQVKQS